MIIFNIEIHATISVSYLNTYRDNTYYRLFIFALFQIHLYNY